MNRVALLRTPLRYLVLVQERHVGHRAALGLGVHHDPMPERQRDGGMVAMTHRPACVNARVTAASPANASESHWDCAG